MAEKANKREYATRFGMFVLAGLFLITSVGFSLLVIWQVKQQHKQEATQAAITAAVNSTNNPKKGATKLEGTKLEGFTPIATVDTLQNIDTVPGTGAEVKSSDTITAHYTGALAATGVIFQSSLDSGQPFTSPLSGLIAGWQKGIPGMKVGGTRRLLIPAAQAYGAQSQQGIPANSDLVFDIQLISIK
jgi:FKBP-type peptidyl-prolyl cis-trans isomerase